MRANNQELFDQIENYVEEFCKENGCGPTVRDIACKFNIAVGTAFKYMDILKNDGKLIKGSRGDFRKNLSSLSETPIYNDCGFPYIDVKVIGSISCGQLEEAFQESGESVRFPLSMVGKGDFYLLKAHGDSMIKAGIENGDLVLIDRSKHPQMGDIIVALVENEVTLKRLSKNNDGVIYLHPENDKYDDIYVDSIESQGVAVKVIKDLK